MAAAPTAGRAPLQWLGWDGRVLRWRLAVAPADLTLDGAVFERAIAAGDGERAFDVAPGGQDEIEFAFAGADGAPLAAPWRVRFGEPAPAGADRWHGAPRTLAPLAATPRLPRQHWGEPPLAVVVPVHNAAASVQRCLEALARWTPADVAWILIDDASTDSAIAPLLARWTARANVRVARNGVNAGYTRSVNTGIALAGNADVVLLNSDTEVGPLWLQCLRAAAYADADVGTATAVSDNAGAFSVPELEQYSPPPPRWTLVQAQRTVLQQAGLRYPELPTGNGFCMYVKRALIERIGVMDAEAFPAGYGEENDFCQRAAAAGFRHLVAGNVLVRHERSASFGDARRAALGAQGMAVLRRRYPRYEADVGATLYSFSRRVLDWRVRRAYAGAPARARVLGVARDEAGAARMADDLGRAGEPFVLVPGTTLRLAAATGRPELVMPHDAADAADRLGAWLLVQAVEAVCCAADVAPPSALVRAAARLGLPVVSAADAMRAVRGEESA